MLWPFLSLLCKPIALPWHKSITTWWQLTGKAHLQERERDIQQHYLKCERNIMWLCHQLIFISHTINNQKTNWPRMIFAIPSVTVFKHTIRLLSQARKIVETERHQVVTSESNNVFIHRNSYAFNILQKHVTLNSIQGSEFRTFIFWVMQCCRSSEPSLTGQERENWMPVGWLMFGCKIKTNMLQKTLLIKNRVLYIVLKIDIVCVCLLQKRLIKLPFG